MQLEDIVCGAEVRSIDIKLTPKLHELVDQGLRVELDETVSVAICEALEAFTNKFEQRLNKLIRSPVIEIKVSNTSIFLNLQVWKMNYVKFDLCISAFCRKLSS